MCSAIALLLPLLAGLPQADDAHQIHWQRSYEDALSLARSSGRALLIAVNMDGESASEHLARERYRDPRFVAWTRAFVCVVASPVRHNPRDYDDSGRRLVCPRLGCVTCGEHLAIEPRLFEEFLGGERVAPRHALVRPGGEKIFDLFLLFDLHEIDRALEKAAAQAGAAPEAPLPEELAELVSDRRQRARTRLEELFAGAQAAAKLKILAALGEPRAAPAADLDLLRLALCDPAAEVRARATELAVQIGAKTLEPFVREGLQWARDDVRRERLTAWLAFDPAGRAAERLLVALALDGDPASRALANRPLRERFAALAAAVRAAGEPTDLCVGLGECGRGPLVAAAPWSDVPEEPACELLLDRCQVLLDHLPEDGWVLAEAGRASLLLAERKILAGADPTLVLADARQFLTSARAKLPERSRERAEVDLMEARCAWNRSDFASAARLAERALGGARAAGAADLLAEAARSVLALALRELMAGRESESGADFAGRFARAARALEALAKADGLLEGDWVKAGDAMSLAGRWRDQALLYGEGLHRFPGSTALHQRLRDLLLAGGRLDELLATLESLQREAPEDATVRWFRGYARILQGEACRRALAFPAARESYAAARALFASSRELNEDYAASVAQWLARIALGAAQTELALGEIEAAREQLIEALRGPLDPERSADGLGLDLQDLIDGLVESRAFDPGALAARLGALDPVPLKAIDGVAMACLREAYRARGRAQEELAGEFFEHALHVLKEERERDPAFARQRDLVRALLETARRRARAGETEEMRSLFQEAEQILRRPWGEEAIKRTIEEWIGDLGPSRSFVRQGR